MLKRRLLSIILYFLIVHASQGKDSISVYIFLLDECRICQEIAPEMIQIHREYGQEIGFIGVFPNFSSKPEGINKFKATYKIPFHTKTDYFKKLSRKMGASITPEIIVYNESLEKVIYRGPINDLYYAPGKRKHFISKNYLSDVLTAIKENKVAPYTEIPAIGCFINFNDL